LKVGDFGVAEALLREAKLLSDARDGALIALAEGVGTDQVVRLLVQRGIPVFEIAPEEQNLESFYLSLMNNNEGDRAVRSIGVN
jgi:hypothetical protein